jgi:hypothetical protein
VLFVRGGAWPGPALRCATGHQKRSFINKYILTNDKQFVVCAYHAKAAGVVVADQFPRPASYSEPEGATPMKRSSTVFLQIVIVLIGVAALALLLWEPQVEGRNANATQFEIYFHDPFLALVYAGAIPFFIALIKAFQALGYVGRDQVFSPEVVKGLRTIKYCALAIIGFVVVEEIVILVMNNGDGEDPGAPIFIGLLITFGSIVVATAAAMFERVLQNAVDIKSENDLTV